MKNTELNEKAQAEKALEEQKLKEEIKVEWLGIDGGLVLMYAILACIYGFGIINRVDWIIGIMAPAVAALMTTLIFIRYCFEVFHFGGKDGKKK